ncbi:MAG: Tn3 family transposase, partial [Actinomycetota bacterium]|nr:Tn3 family transposase [Actinomycetota bacterium]
MAGEIGFDAVVDHFTLTAAELEQLRNKFAETRLGFAVQCKFLLWRGRFPRGRHELPDDAVEHVGRQVGVEASLIGFYDLSGRTAGRHRQEIRGVTGFRVCSAGDADKLTTFLADQVAPTERREDQVRAELLALCRTGLIEPPTPDRQRRIIRSALRQAEQRLFAQTAQRLDAHASASAQLDALIARARDDSDDSGETAWTESPTLDEPVVEVFAFIRAAPGNVSLESMRTEVRKLHAIRALGLPAGLFADVAPTVVNAWRARAAVESPSHLRAHEDRAVRLTLLAALVHLREREITDTLVELLNSVVHKVNATAHRKTTQQLMEAFRRVTGKENILFSIAAAALSAPDDPVRSVVYPAVSGGEKTLRDLVAEFKATGPAYRNIVRTTMRASYTNHYRRGLLELATTLDFRSSNTAHQPVLDAVAVVLRNAGSTSRYYPTSEKPPVIGVVAKDWQPLVSKPDSRGRDRIVRTVYEICVFQALRDRLRCKEIWVIGADQWRNPDEDLPADFDNHRVEHYARLQQPLDAKAFITGLRGELEEALATLNEAAPTLPWLSISDRKAGAIKLAPLQPLSEPKNLRRLKKAILTRHGPVQLIDVLKETALRTGMLTQLTSISTRENIEQSTLWERMLLVAYALGTNVGIRAVAHSSGYSEDDLRYVARRYFTLDGLRASAAAIGNATFAARQETIWGAGTTTVASDSTHFQAYDQNLFTEWHTRYRGRGVLIYWHVEKGAVAIHAQHLKCTASEVAAMIEGVMRHGTTMKVEGNYVDSHGQSEIGFGITCLLGFDLLPRIKQINKVKLYRPDRDTHYPALEPAATRAIRWDLIEQNYDMLIKYATAIRVGTATTEAILRRFTRNASHPVYQAMLEVGRAQKSIFVAKYLHDRKLQHEIEAGLNVVENF